MDFTITLSGERWNAIATALNESNLAHKFVVDLLAEMQMQVTAQEQAATISAVADIIKSPAKRGRKPKVAKPVDDQSK